MKILVVMVILLGCARAEAQQQALPYSPFTIDQQTFESFRRAFGQLKFDDAYPLIRQWEQLEIAAQQKQQAQQPKEPDK